MLKLGTKMREVTMDGEVMNRLVKTVISQESALRIIEACRSKYLCNAYYFGQDEIECLEVWTSSRKVVWLSVENKNHRAPAHDSRFN